jgi:hypothetical protein
VNIGDLSQVLDLGLNGVLLIVLWQGLLRFDRLLAVVIQLALLSHSDPVTRENARDQLSRIANGQR